jgi:hypothetical protein
MKRVYQCVEVRAFPNKSDQRHVDSILEAVGRVKTRKSQVAVNFQSITVKINDG